MAWQDREKEFENLQAVQQKVGEICMIWSALDYQIDQILGDLLDVGTAQLAAVMTGLDFSRKCETIQRLLVLGGPSATWIAEVDAYMAELASSLNKQRNRYVHDAWTFEVDAIKRVERTAKKQKAQSHQPYTLVFDKEHPESLEKMTELCDRAYVILSRLTELRPYLAPWLIAQREKLR